MDREKVKIYAVVGVLVLCMAWLIYYISTSVGSGYGPPRPLETPAWNDANEINKKLLQDKRFLDVGLSVVTEHPRKYRVVGLVHSSAELAALKDLLQQEASGAELEYEVHLPD